MAQWALDFNGTSDRVDFGAGGLGLSTAETTYTIELWFKAPTQVTNSRRLACDRDNVSTTPILFQCYLNPNGTLGLIVRDDANNLLILETGDTFDDDVWHYAAFVRDGNSFEIFVDGVSKATSTATIGTITLSNRVANLAYDGWEDGRAFDGIIDEVRISNKARILSEIQAIWNSGVGKRFEVDGDTVALWHMDEGANSTIYDETANDNDGTIVGASWVGGFPFPIVGRSFGYIIG